MCLLFSTDRIGPYKILGKPFFSTLVLKINPIVDDVQYQPIFCQCNKPQLKIPLGYKCLKCNTIYFYNVRRKTNLTPFTHPNKALLLRVHFKFICFEFFLFRRCQLVRIEPPRGKTNNVVSEQVRHKPACTSTEKS